MRIFIISLTILFLTFFGLINIAEEEVSDLQRFAKGYTSFENGTLIEIGSALFFDILSLEPVDDLYNICKLIFLEIVSICIVVNRRGRVIWADLLIASVLFPYIFCINLKFIGVLFVMFFFSSIKRINIFLLFLFFFMLL